MDKRIGVVGGSGLYEMDGLEVLDEVNVETPFGAPSGAYVLGMIEGRAVAFLSRHGRGHLQDPTHVPYRANVYGFKLLGVDNLFSVSAVGSLREEIEPLHLVVPDQFVDRTRNRPSSFFGEGIAVHVSMADPVCPILSDILVRAAEAAGAAVHRGGTYVCIEGPQFSTRAESQLFRSWGMDIIGMTNITEARLAREAGIAYATLAMACDYDCWHDGHDDVTADMAVANLLTSVDMARKVLRRAVGLLPESAPSSCADVLSSAIISSREAIDPATRARLAALLDPVFGDTP